MSQSLLFILLVLAILQLVSCELTLPPLPYDYDALEPHISKRTLEIHHGKHHAKYISNSNDLIAGTDMDDLSLVDLLSVSWTDKNQNLFNNVAQSFNHQFYWECMKPNGGGMPTGELAEMINDSFGSYDKFLSDIKAAGASIFGSGWSWLVHRKETNKLSIINALGAMNPLVNEGLTPLLVIDVWEHAYYLDYQNLRPKYLEAFMAHLVNWDFVSAQLPRENELDLESDLEEF